MSIDNKEAFLQNELPGPSQGEILPTNQRPSRQGKGGGPKTAAGKAGSSANALTHGITSKASFIPGMESQEEAEAHRQGFFDHFGPEGYGEEFLVGRLAELSWRLKRVRRHEDALVTQKIVDLGFAPAFAEAYANALAAPLEDDDDDEDSPANRAFQELRISLLREVYLLPFEPKRESIMRYEAHLHRQFIQMLHELEALQARRTGRPTFLGRFDVTGSPAA